MAAESQEPAQTKRSAKEPSAEREATSSLPSGFEEYGFGIPEDIDSARVFQLMGQMLPLEVCLYHRIVPLRQAKGRLTLGMVDPTDQDALTYAERLVAYQGLIMEPVLLAGSVHQSLLSAYLNHVGKPATDLAGTVAGMADGSDLDRLDRTEIEADWFAHGDRFSLDSSGVDNELDSSELFSGELSGDLSEDEEMESAELACPEPKLTRVEGINAESTLCAEVPETVEPIEPEALEQRAADFASKPQVDERATLHLPDDESLVLGAAGDELPDAALLFPAEGDSSVDSFLPPTPPKPAIAFPPLHVEIQHLMEPIEAIVQLPAPKFLAELFGRILAGGISRVLLGSNGGPGRIAWDRNGVAQLALGAIEPQAFQALVAELKAVTGLPAGKLKKPVQRRILRSCEGQPVMLKLQVEPTGLNAMSAPRGPGEKIQIQILRGARLIAHEQQRLDKLQEEAIATANLLQQKLQQIELITQSLPMVEPSFDALEQLTAVVHKNVVNLPTRG